MRIAVYTNWLQDDRLGGIVGILDNVFKRLAKQQPHQFLFLESKSVNSSSKIYGNVEEVIIPKRSSIFFFRRISHYRIARVLHKEKANVFVTSAYFFNPFSVLPQVLIVSNLTTSQKQNFHKVFAKAKIVCTVSEYLRNEIINNYKIDGEKILNIGCAADIVFQPVEWREKENIKQTFTDECEYFLFVTTMHSESIIMDVLKAFSIFKRWQKTNMKLLIVTNSTMKNAEEKLKTFKHRNDVKLLHHLSSEETAKITAGAYALIFPSSLEGFALPVLQAMKCEVPVITSRMGSMLEIGGDAVLYSESSSPQHIADKMKIIFKDEQLRSHLIALAKARAETFSLQKTTALLWQAIGQAVSA